jgi:hypothetical protein
LSSRPDPPGACGIDSSIGRYVHCFIANRSRSIGCNFIDHACDADHVGRFITIGIAIMRSHITFHDVSWI